MKLERLHESLTTTIVIAVGMALAFYGGHLSGSGEKAALSAMVIGVLLVVTALGLQTRVWLLIPVAWSLTGQILILPLPVTVRDLVVIFVFGTFLTLRAMKLHRLKPTFGLLEFFIVVNVLYVATTFMRNPVGSLATTSTRVGGRPYFAVLIGVLAYWVLARSVCTARQARVLPWWVAGVSSIVGFVTLICQRFPALSIIGVFYSDFATDRRLTGDELAGTDAGETGDRITPLADPGRSVGLVLCSYYRPLTLINPLYVFRFLSLLIATAMIFLSGFRSAFISLCLFFMVSAYFRKGWIDVMRIIAVAVPALTLLILAQGSLIHLPNSAQRALSFLPGHWDLAATEDAEESTRWRVEMWKEALTTNKYIESRWLGDGFGISIENMREIQMIQAAPTLGYADSQESSALVGNFHSGPISAIRCVGFVGLVLYYLLTVRMAYEAVQLIRRARESLYFPLALFIGIPIVIHPFYFTFVFGGYDPDFSTTLFQAGLLKMLSNSLPATQVQPPVSLPEMFPKGNNYAPGRGRRQFEPSIAGVSRLHG